MKKNNKILLVSANTWTSPYPVYPLGVSYLKSYIKNTLREYEVEVADMNFMQLEDLSAKIRNGNYGFIGLSLRNIDDNNSNTYNSFVAWYKRLADTIMETNTNAYLILGGAGYSIYPQMLMNELNADYGVKGEGEKALCELIVSLNEGKPVEQIEGLVYKDKNSGEIIVNERNNYANSFILNFERDWVDYYWDKSGMLNIQTKRGCPKKCIYCSYPVIEGKCVRTLDCDSIVDTLKQLYAEYKINYVFFTDSIFNIDRKYNSTLCNKIIDSGLKISWGAYFSPNNLTEDDLLLYKKSGLTHIEFGTDAFCDTMLKRYKKGFGWKDVLRASKMCDEFGIFYAHFMILGGVGETDETLDATFENSRELTNCVIFPYIGMRIYPHTELYDISVSEGIVHTPEELLLPKYYISKNITLSTIKERALASGAKWIFPEDESEEKMALFRAKKRKGPLWEYLKF